MPKEIHTKAERSQEGEPEWRTRHERAFREIVGHQHVKLLDSRRFHQPKQDGCTPSIDSAAMDNVELVPMAERWVDEAIRNYKHPLKKTRKTATKDAMKATKKAMKQKAMKAMKKAMKQKAMKAMKTAMKAMKKKAMKAMKKAMKQKAVKANRHQ